MNALIRVPMNLHRISVKYFLDSPQGLDLGSVIPVFHDWIRQGKVPGLLIDVADYGHMVDGPGVMLIGHEVDYALDMSQGRPGLLHVRKRRSNTDADARANTSPNGQLATVFHGALLACKYLEQENSLGTLKFNTGNAVLTYLDKLSAPNSEQTFNAVIGEIESFLSTVYQGGQVSIQRVSSDDRDPFAVSINVTDAATLDTLIDRLAASVS